MSLLLAQDECNVNCDATPLGTRDPRIAIKTGVSTYTRYGTINDINLYTDYNPMGHYPLRASQVYDSGSVFWLHVYTRAVQYNDSQWMVIASSSHQLYDVRIEGRNVFFRSKDDADAVYASFTYDTSPYIANLDYFTLDLKIDVASDQVGVYLNGVLRSTESILLNSKTTGFTFDRVEVRSSGATSGAEISLSEMIMTADEETIGWRCKTLYPTSNGTYQWATGDYSDIDETAISDSDFVQTATSADSTYNYSDVSAAEMDEMQVVALVLSTVATSGVGAPAPVVGNVIYDGAILHDVGNTEDVTSGVYAGGTVAYSEANPSTGSQWEFTHINSYEFGFKSTT